MVVERLNSSQKLLDLCEKGVYSSYTSTIDGTLLLDAASGNYTVGQVYNVLTASSLSGTFSTVTSTNGTSFKVEYDPTDNPNGVDAIYLSTASTNSGGSNWSQFHGWHDRGRNRFSVFSALGFALDGSATDPLLFAAARTGSFEIYDSLGGEVQLSNLMAMTNGHWAFLDRLVERSDMPDGGGAIAGTQFSDGTSVRSGGVTAWSVNFDANGG